MISFSKSQIAKFKHTNKALRYGQAFHQVMKLEKCNEDKFFCDKLYNADEATKHPTNVGFKNTGVQRNVLTEEEKEIVRCFNSLNEIIEALMLVGHRCP